MKIGVLIPYRGTSLDKSRLRKNITSKVVDELLHQMTQQVIIASTSLSEEYNTYLLTKNESVKFIGDFTILKDQGEVLNDSIKLAVSSLKEDIILIVMADLPFVRKEDLERVVNLHKTSMQAIVAPSSDDGTSLLCFNLKEPFDFVFGYNSAVEYQKLFTEKGIKFKLLKHEKYYRDIDTFKDLREMKEFDFIPIWLKKIVDLVV
ncbi:MAG: NTP transferase domain-containing protein [Candidatus Heimdallarchaeaceae archaeon]|jgi:2-phospho-L-lactate guanylyltransferase